MSYSDYDHNHCFNDPKPACGSQNHLACCLCRKPNPNRTQEMAQRLFHADKQQLEGFMEHIVEGKSIADFFEGENTDPTLPRQVDAFNRDLILRQFPQREGDRLKVPRVIPNSDEVLFEEKPQKEQIEDAMRDLVSALHDEFCFTRLATEQQWNEAIAPKLRDLALAIEGLPKGTPTARVYKFPHDVET